MVSQIREVLRRSDTLGADFIGASALVLLLIAGLWLPGLF